PALQLSKTDLRDALNESGARATSGKGRHRTRRALVIAELGLSITLVAGAALLVRSYLNLRQVQLGFDPSHVLTFELSLPPPPGSDGWTDAQVDANQRQRTDRLLQLLSQISGVDQVGATNYLPLSKSNVNGG